MLLNTHNSFKVSAQRFQFPNEPANNYMVFQGPINCHSMRTAFPIKLILPANYPLSPPKVYFDMQLPMEVV